MAFDINPATEEQLLEASEDLLVALCYRITREKECTIGGCEGGNRVVKISDKIAVKYGFGMTAAEAATQKFAYQKVNPNIVHVPRVYRFIHAKPVPPSSHSIGYLFMEYIPGRNLKDVDLEVHKDIIPHVAGIVAHLGQLQGGQRPGPIGGGEVYGYLWGDFSSNITFNSVADLNAWLNKRLALRNISTDMRTHPLVLCHMDLCRRNMILEKDGKSICLLDWAYAGLFPRFFEVATIHFLHDPPYKEPLLRAVETTIKLTDRERELIKLMQFVRAASMRYLLDENVKPFDITKMGWGLPPPLPSQGT